MDYVRGVPVDSVLTTISSRSCERVVKRRCVVLFKVLNPHLEVRVPRDVAGEIGRHLYAMAKSNRLELVFHLKHSIETRVAFYSHPTESLLLAFFEKSCASFGRKHVWIFSGQASPYEKLAIHGDYLDIVESVVQLHPGVLVAKPA
uniref:Uncharacterized protein n=1 Tax=viral metagenome TaxID=1070528 RepID=A0A6C0BN13_9ZZZZ